MISRIQDINAIITFIFQRMEVLRLDYQNQLQKVSTLKRQLNDLELRETEEINQLEFERSLLNAEFDSETQKISKVKMKIALLKHKETRLSGIYDELQKEFKSKINQAHSRIAHLEEDLDRISQNSIHDHEMESQMRYINEKLEIERKNFEDVEFHQMEEAAHKETEREELLREIADLDRQIDSHESKLTEMDLQQKELLANVRKETEGLEKQRKSITETLNKVKMLKFWRSTDIN